MSQFLSVTWQGLSGCLLWTGQVFGKRPTQTLGGFSKWNSVTLGSFLRFRRVKYDAGVGFINYSLRWKLEVFTRLQVCPQVSPTTVAVRGTRFLLWRKEGHIGTQRVPHFSILQLGRLSQEDCH